MKSEVIICVDDEDVILNSLRSELAKNFSEYTIELAQSAKEALEVMAELQESNHEVLVIVSDYIMPEMNGDELLIKIHEKYPEVIKIMLTGQANVDGVVNAINNADLYRYLSKPWEKDDFIMTIKQGIKSYRDTKYIKQYQRELEDKVEEKTRDLTKTLETLKIEMQEKEKIQKKLIRIATIDPLTGIYNRRKLFLVLEKYFVECASEDINLHIMMLDIDCFKKINDTYGHNTGDIVLKKFVKVIYLLLDSKKDFFARFGGEEFIIVSKNRLCIDIYSLAQEIRQAVQSCDMPYKEEIFHITTSIGISLQKNDDQVIDDLIHRADEYLYLAKEHGRNMIIDDKRAEFLKKHK